MLVFARGLGGKRGDRDLPWGCVAAARGSQTVLIAAAPSPPSLDREAGPALGTPALDDEAPGASGHASPKPVGAGALQFAGLVGSFHEEIRRKTKGWVYAEAGRLRSRPARVKSGRACG